MRHSEKLRRALARADSGLAAVEGMIAMTMMIFILVMFMSFGFLLYQQWIVSSVANDAATRVAQSYAYPDTDPVMGYIRRTMKQTMSPFRYLGSGLADGGADKGENYAQWALEQISFIAPDATPDVQVRTVHDSLAQRHIEVEITAAYQIPFGGALEYFGIDSHITYHAVGRAVCLDVSNYMHSVDTLNSLSGTTFGSKVLGAANSVLSAIQKMVDAFSR